MEGESGAVRQLLFLFHVKQRDVWFGVIHLNKPSLIASFCIHHIKMEVNIDLLGNVSTSIQNIGLTPLLFYFESFGDAKILEFLIKLDNKFSGDWIARETPTFRIDSMNAILKKIEQVSKLGNTNDEKINELLNSTEFDFNYKEFVLQLEENTIYGRRYARYVLYKLDYLYGSKSEKKSSKYFIVVFFIFFDELKSVFAFIQ
ncbi:hypothetical protein [Haliscomenobacter sp.]|uniref:hypothetical protein n=1 Tax=Haliscomenobacter sp. TaxID=2717303 RepID=UPI003593C0E1